MAHLIDRLHADLELLARDKLLDSADVHFIRSKLDAIPLGNALDALHITPRAGDAPPATTAATPAPERGQCKAVWNYTKSQPDDLGFQQGDVIDIVEEVNNDWWKGRLHGQTGLFPSNHVERIANSSNRAPPPPPPAPAHSQSNGPYDVGHPQPSQSSFSSGPPMSSYGVPPPPPPHQGQYAYQTPQNYSQSNYSDKQAYQPPPPQHFNPPPPPLQHYAPPPVSVSVSQSAPISEEEKKKKFPGGKFGKQVGTAFAGGMGFGAGSAITSNAINAIF
ncbi:hypothetical protein JCM11491_001281 [Sporobolomyces phaffii]